MKTIEELPGHVIRGIHAFCKQQRDECKQGFDSRPNLDLAHQTKDWDDAAEIMKWLEERRRNSNGY